MKAKLLGVIALALLLVGSLLVSTGVSGVQGKISVQAISSLDKSGIFETMELEDEKHFCTATLDDDFTDDVVIVTMTRQASLNLRSHTTSDFPETRLQNVRSLSTAVESNVREQLLEMQNGLDTSRNGLVRDVSRDIDIENFRQIISLALETPSKENILSAIRALEQRDDVYAAEPNFIAMPGSLANIRSQQAVTRVSLPRAWDITHGSANITVGIMDTGVDNTRPDLANRLHPATQTYTEISQALRLVP